MSEAAAIVPLLPAVLPCSVAIEGAPIFNASFIEAAGGACPIDQPLDPRVPAEPDTATPRDDAFDSGGTSGIGDDLISASSPYATGGVNGTQPAIGENNRNTQMNQT